MKNERVPTGILELDRLIQGGLRSGKTYLVIGEPGTGKTVFALQFLVNGLMNKEKGLYVAIDEKPADVMDQAKSLGWDLAPFIDSKDFLILDASAYFGARAAEGQARSIDVQRVVTDLSKRLERLKSADHLSQLQNEVPSFAGQIAELGSEIESLRVTVEPDRILGAKIHGTVRYPNGPGGTAVKLRE